MTESAHAFNEANPTEAGDPKPLDPGNSCSTNARRSQSPLMRTQMSSRRRRYRNWKKRYESDNDSEDVSDEDSASVKETDMHPSTSSVLLTQTVEQRINELAMTLTQDQLTTNAIEHINEWQDIITDDDGDDDGDNDGDSKDDLA
jgi:hypothetical protein